MAWHVSLSRASPETISHVEQRVVEACGCSVRKQSWEVAAVF